MGILKRLHAKYGKNLDKLSADERKIVELIKTFENKDEPFRLNADIPKKRRKK